MAYSTAGVSEYFNNGDEAAAATAAFDSVSPYIQQILPAVRGRAFNLLHGVPNIDDHISKIEFAVLTSVWHHAVVTATMFNTCKTEEEHAIALAKLGSFMLRKTRLAALDERRKAVRHLRRWSGQDAPADCGDTANDSLNVKTDSDPTVESIAVSAEYRAVIIRAVREALPQQTANFLLLRSYFGLSRDTAASMSGFSQAHVAEVQLGRSRPRLREAVIRALENYENGPPPASTDIV